MSSSFHPTSHFSSRKTFCPCALCCILFSSFFSSYFVHLKACFLCTPQVNPGQWSQMASNPQQGSPHNIPRMGAPLAIPEAPLYPQIPPPSTHYPAPGTQVPYQGGQVPHQGGQVPGDQAFHQGVGHFNPPAAFYNNQYHQPSDSGDSRPMWIPPSPY